VDDACLQLIESEAKHVAELFDVTASLSSMFISFVHNCKRTHEAMRAFLHALKAFNILHVILPLSSLDTAEHACFM
jgi:hypothetical protein